MPHMTTYGDQRDQKLTGSAIKPSVCLSRSGPEVSVRLSVRPKHFPSLLDEPYARELQAQGACTLRFFRIISVLQHPTIYENCTNFSALFRKKYCIFTKFEKKIYEKFNSSM